MRAFIRSSRWFLGGALCLALACQPSSGARGEVARPADAGVGVVVAKVLLVKAEAWVVAVNGVRFLAVPGMPLLKSDTLQVIAPGSFLVVHLSNGYLVRVDEDTLLPVAEIVVLDAPPAWDDLATQLERLLSAEERAGSERIAGWHARMSAADSVPPTPSQPVPEERPARGRKAMAKLDAKDLQSTDEREKVVQAKGGTEARVPGKGGTESREPTRIATDKLPPEPPGVTSGLVAAQAPGSGGGPSGEGGGPGGGQVDEPSSGQALGGPRWEAAAGGVVPEALAKLLADRGWIQCVEAALAAVPAEVRPGKLTVLVEVHAGKLGRLRLGGGLPTPACLQTPGLRGQPAPAVAADGWLRLTLHLP